MTNFYSWLKTKLVKLKPKRIPAKTKTNFELYCEQNPWARECRIYED
jgi:hypothetical protein